MRLIPGCTSTVSSGLVRRTRQIGMRRMYSVMYFFSHVATLFLLEEIERASLMGATGAYVLTNYGRSYR